MRSTVTAKVKIRKDERLVKTMRVYSKALQFCIERLGANSTRGERSTTSVTMR